jgi:glycopeptide antibiotics resistance protein
LAVAFGWSSSGLATKQTGTIGLRGVLLSVWSVGLLFANWFPFDFNQQAELYRSNGKGFNWMPFLDYYEHDYIDAFNTMFQKMLVFGPIGVLLSSGRRKVSWVVVALVSLVFAIGIEVGQFFLPGHYPTISDVLIEPVGALVGYFLLKLVRTNQA